MIMIFKRICPFRIVLLFFLSGLGIQAQERYVDPVFSKIKMDTYTYADTLQLDFYSAKGDAETLKPLLLLVHGGGFAIGKRDNVLEKKFAMDMAKRGYAVASISYRLTRKGKSFGCDCPAEEKIKTFLAVSEDILKASRYLVERANGLRFDQNQIVLVGSSAGAEAVLNTAFLQHRLEFRKLPYGNLNFAGVVSFAGAVLNADYITPTNALPTLLFHGQKDNLVPFATAPHHYCAENATGFLILDGSQSIADRLKILDTPYTLVLDPDGNHDWANLPYTEVELISHFIKQCIIDGEHYQTKIKIAPKN